MSGMFDLHGRLLKIDSNGDFLVALDRLVPWESFRERLQVLRDKPRKSNAGARGYDPVMMFKVLVLQSMYNLSDAATEAQIRALKREIELLKKTGVQPPRVGQPGGTRQQPPSRTIEIYRGKEKTVYSY